MAGLSLVVVKNPFDRRDADIQVAPYHPHMTLAEVIASCDLPAALAVVVSINGQVIPAEQWEMVSPREGDHVLIVPLVTGGSGGGKTVLRAVLMVVVAIVAVYTGGAILGAMGTTFATAGTGALALAAGGMMAVNLIGGMLINALLPMPNAKFGATDPGQISQAYSWSPATTQSQGVVISRFYGRNKLTGNIISAFVDSVGAQQYYNALIELGLGPFGAVGVLPDGSRNFWINDQPDSQFQGVDIETRVGMMDQDPMLNFGKTRVATPVAVKVIYPTFPHTGSPFNYGYTYTTPEATEDEIEVEVTIPNGLFFANDQGGMSNNYVDLSVQVRESGVGDAVLWINLTTQTYSTPPPADIWHWEWNYWDGVNNIGWVKVRDDPRWNNMDPLAHTEGEVVIGAPTPPLPPGDMQPTIYRWLFGRMEGNTSGPCERIVGNSAAPFRKTYSYTPPPGKKQYDIRIRKLTGERNSFRYGDSVFLTTVTSALADDFSYPRSALVAVRALATDQLSGALRFSCLADCALIRTWDGTSWQIIVSDNPAWVTFDILTQPVFDNDLHVIRYDGISPERLDLPAFLSWADWCDEMVPDGKGGTEKRCLFDGGFDSESTMWESALRVCQTARAVLVWNGVRLSVSVDRRQDVPIQLFSVANIGADSYRETFLPFTDRASEIEVDYINRDRGYIRDKFTVFLPDLDTLAVKTTLSLFGVDRPSQAWREAMYRLYRNKYITRTCEITVDIDAIACTIGDLIYVQHDVPAWGEGGRIVAATETTFTLDKPVTIADGKTYEIMIRLADDQIVSRVVANDPGETETLTVATPFSAVPAQFDVYTFGETTKVAKPFTVTGLRRQGDQSATITGIEYNGSIHNVDTEDPVLPTPNYSMLSAG